MNDRLKDFIEMNDKQGKLIKDLEKRFATISTLRVFSFLIGIVCVAFGSAGGGNVLFPIGIVLLIAFCVLVKKHSRVVEETEIAKSKKLVIERYIARYNEEWRKFEENGKEFIDEKDIVASDIDLLGRDSLYQMISVCHTEGGKRKLSDMMKKLEVTEDIKARQEAVSELIDEVQFSIDYEAAGIRLEKSKKRFDLDEFVEYCKDEKLGILPGWANAVSIIFPLIEIGLIVAWIIGLLNYGAPILGFVIILAFSWLTKSVVGKVLSPLGNIMYVAEDYYVMLKMIGENDYKSKLLVDMKETVAGDKGALKAFAKLNQIGQACKICFNPLVYQLLSGFILWDYQIAKYVKKWKTQYGANTARSLDVIGDLETLMSLAVVGRVRDTNWAVIDEDCSNGVSFSCEDMYHPLIKPDTVQANSANLNGGITIVTGSNMSGKTTFLRTLAINLALAYMGAPVCAKSLKANYMKIFTSMRIADDVANGISTFYAEILRIKTMADYKKNNKPMLCLIDEIFKGTNSADRIVGAKEVIKRLSGEDSMTIVSTHDFELCTITDDKGKEATNYHFEEYYDNDELKFDYKIKDGRCTTTNAKAILRMAGFSV